VDKNDPKDRTFTKVELVISEQWQSYEIDLAAFEIADLSQLNSLLCFVFTQDPQSFSVRTLRFIDKTLLAKLLS
jgi:hypothetical protein